MSNQLAWDLGSFRDPEGQVFFYEGEVFRTLQDSAIEKMQSLLGTPFFQNYVEKGQIIQTDLIRNQRIIPELKTKVLLKHEKIPFITYPYEWSFKMLKDAALLTLDILQDCLENNFILKDGTAWNLTFFKGKMCFFDILSIDTYKEGQTWDGYQQFCQEFLFPLLLKAYKGINFQNFFKGTLKGVELRTANQLFSMLDWRKPGIFKHVFLNSKLSENKKVAQQKIRNSVSLPKGSLINIVNNLITIIQKLENKTDHSIWIDYTNNNTYKDHDENLKRSFIESFASSMNENNTIIDLGCNTGQYSFISAKKCQVISCDIDSDCIDSLYQHVSQSGESITPMVLDLMNPSPSCGWQLQERVAIYNRLKGDGFLALALIHHLCIASNVPLESFMMLLKRIARRGVLEWVSKEDPMVQLLLLNREDVFSSYNWECCERSIAKYFKISAIQEINNGTRKLCLLEPKE